MSAGVLETADDGIRFAHPLLAAATYDRATPSRRREVHERLAGFATEPEERARHLARTAVGADGSIAAALDDGAAAAAGRGAPEVAASLAEEAVRLTPSDEADDRLRRRIAAAEYLFAAGDAERADAILTLAATELSPGSALGHVLARRAIFALMFADLDAADILFRRAMPMAVEDPRLRIAIHSGLAGIGYLSWRGWRRARLDMFLALRLARELGDRSLECQALGHSASWLSSLGRPWRHLMERADSLAVPLDAVPVLEHPDLQFGQDPQLPRRPIRRSPQSRAIDRARPCERGLDQHLEPACRAGRDRGRCWRPRRGRADRERGLRRPPADRSRARTTRTSWPLACISMSLRGDVEAARVLGAEVELVAQASAHRWFRSTVQVSLAMLDHSLGDAAATYGRLSKVVSEPGLGRLAPLHWESIVAYTAESLISLGRLEEARRLLDPVERRARRRRWPAAIAEVARARALVLAADGDHEGAVRYAEEAVRIHAGLQVPFRTARAWFTLGEVLRRSRQKGASRAAFGSALELFTQLRARVWIERTTAELGRVAMRRPAGSAAHGDRATGRRAGRVRADQPGDRRCAVHQRPHGRGAPDPGVPDAGGPVAHRAGTRRPRQGRRGLTSRGLESGGSRDPRRPQI